MFFLGFGDLVICKWYNTKGKPKQFTKKDVKFQEFGDWESRCLGGSPQEKSRREGLPERSWSGTGDMISFGGFPTFAKETWQKRFQYFGGSLLIFEIIG